MLYQILPYTIHGKFLKNHTKTTKFKVSAPLWNENLDLLDGLYSIRYSRLF